MSLEIKNLEYELLRERIISNFNLFVNKGEIHTLFGASGCGKTTILRLITGLNTAKRGEIVNKFKKTAYLFQEDRLLAHKNALENILIVNKNANLEYVFDLLNSLGLSKRDALKYPDELSGGMRKRVSFTRALITNPDILLMDEPFSGLDTDMRSVLIDKILKRVKNGMSVILVTHDRFEAVSMSDEIYFMAKKGGEIVKKLKISTPQRERNFEFISHIIEENFKTELYFD